MIYPYRCIVCNHDFEVIKSVREIDQAESCPQCQAPASRYIARTYFYGASDWDQAAYNPAFGKVIRNRTHLKEELRIASREGREMVEVGNEPLDNIHKSSEKRRSERSEERWKKVDRELGFA